MSAKWRRPASVPFPSVWHRFRGARTNREYWVQDISEEYMAKVLDILCTQFVKDESLCRHCSSPVDAKAMEDFRPIWEECLEERLGLLCLTKNDEGKEVIVGLNATKRSYKGEPYPEVVSPAAQKVFGAMIYVNDLKDPYSTLQIDDYLSALGLLVMPQYRGENIGLEILKAREPMCKAMGIKASLTTFTGIASQTLARKAGFQVLCEVDYDELEKINPALSFPGITEHTKALKRLLSLSVEQLEAAASGTMSAKWRRPASVPFPSVWHRFRGARTNREYWVQDIPDEYMGQVLDILCTQFIKDASLCRHCSIPIDKQTIQEFRSIWEDCLKQRLGLLCLTKNNEGQEVIVGVNVTKRSYKGESLPQVTSPAAQNILGAALFVTDLKDPFTIFRIDEYLNALGLLVMPQYRGENIGMEILKAREPLCKAIGLKASLTIFTGIASQTLARKAGFKLLSQIDYDELEKINPAFRFPGITEHTKSLEFMYIIYE